MPQMQVHRPETSRVVVGPCPGCFTWQVEYDPQMVARDYTPGEFQAVVESLLQLHLTMCPGLQEIVEEAGYNTP